MMYRIFVVLLVITLTVSQNLNAQNKLLFYVSIQGSWDKHKQKDKAQYGGDNKLLNSYFASFRTELIQIGDDGSGMGSISFVITADGKVDSIAIKESMRIGTWDSIFYQIVQMTSGKWRAGQVEGVKQSEAVTLWYNIYKGPAGKKSMEQYIEEAQQAMAKSDYKKALSHADNALSYDALNVDAMIIKTKALVSLQQPEKACDFIKPTAKYNNVRLNEVISEHCN